MSKHSRALIIFFIVAGILSCGKNNLLKESRIITSYPSASGIEYFQDKLYVIGDDANHLLVLDKELKVIDSIRLFSFPEKRIKKDVKADFESITVTRDKKLFLLGSGSLSPYRNTARIIDPNSRKIDSIELGAFFRNVEANGVKEINIEGLTSIPGGMLLANRGNKNYPRNFLIMTNSEFWKDPLRAPLSLIAVGSSADSTVFNGISGLTYSASSDRLIMSVSTEDTRNSMDDGAIGKSYLWIVRNFSTKKRWKAINPDDVIDLETIDPIFKGQKIESVCVTKETRNFLYIVLAADNDNGSSSLFNMIIEKN